MYSVKKNKKLLELLQELYQQKVISQEDKNLAAKGIRKSFVTKSYVEVKIIWKTIEKRCLIEEKRYLMDDFYYILGGN